MQTLSVHCILKLFDLFGFLRHYLLTLRGCFNSTFTSSKVKTTGRGCFELVKGEAKQLSPVMLIAQTETALPLILLKVHSDKILKIQFRTFFASTKEIT